VLLILSYLLLINSSVTDEWNIKLVVSEVCHSCWRGWWGTSSNLRNQRTWRSSCGCFLVLGSCQNYFALNWIQVTEDKHEQCVIFIFKKLSLFMSYKYRIQFAVRNASVGILNVHPFTVSFTLLFNLWEIKRQIASSDNHYQIRRSSVRSYVFL
jgi:hypothetical protein